MMGGNGFGDSTAAGEGFEALARKYWSAWGEALRSAAPGATEGAAQAPAWEQWLQQWQQGVPGLPAELRDAVGKFQATAGGWYAQMQQLAAQLAGQAATPAEIAEAWRAALESSGNAGNPFASLLQASPLGGQEGFDSWLAQVQPFLQLLQGAGPSGPVRWLDLPTFGLAREHQTRWQQLGKALHEYQQRNNEYQAEMARVLQAAHALFERKLAEHQGPGRALASARGLFDLWIDAAEEAYAEAALSEGFSQLQGRLANAQMRLRQAVQVEVEKLAALFGMPTRSEVDSAHRKIAQLERSVRALAQALQARGGATTTGKPAQAAGRPAATRPAKTVKAAKAVKGKQPAKTAKASVAKAKSAGKLAGKLAGKSTRAKGGR